MSRVSWDMRNCCSGVSDCSVRMLCSRSASLMKTTRRSSAIATSIFLRFSAWLAPLKPLPRRGVTFMVVSEILPSLVVASTSLAISGPNFSTISLFSTPQFSSTSCSKAAASELASSCRFTRIIATCNGCSM